MTQIDLEKLKRVTAPESEYSDLDDHRLDAEYNRGWNGALNVVKDKLAQSQATKADDLKHAPTIEKLKERLER